MLKRAAKGRDAKTVGRSISFDYPPACMMMLSVFHDHDNHVKPNAHVH
jgi:hypothetical protein